MSPLRLIALLLAAPALASGQQPPAGVEDYRTPVGRVEAGALRVTLEVGEAMWRPWGDNGPALVTTVFAADGSPARVPGPLLRVTAGTPVHVTLRNRLEDSVVVRGLRDRNATPPPGPAFAALLQGAVEVAPGESREVWFTPTVPGTYFYFGSVLQPLAEGAPRPVFSPTRGPFTGVLVVDPPDASPPDDERILLITHWADLDLPASWSPTIRFMINGRSWPHTERLDYLQGDTVRWRVINATGLDHPMHLHGFHFHVEAHGDQWRETVHPPDQRPLVVTENLAPGQTMRISWVPHEPGNWVFHCHLMRHMSWLQTAALDGTASAGGHAGHHAGPRNGEELMGGLVLGITIRPAAGHAPPAEIARRRLDLHIGMRPGVFGSDAGYGFVLREGSEPPADSIRFPGSPLVLTRGEPTRVVVHNRADVALGVHWHGLELESRADGVPGWSGSPGAVIPAISPGDSLAVQITPPRAGTFMYHVHSEPGHQLAQGLYGSFLVMERGHEWDPGTDRLFLLGSLGAEEHAPPAVNGELEPGPIRMSAGTTYRLRFMHISPDDQKRVQLLAGDEPVVWRMVAKDGADLPASQEKSSDAAFDIHVGETYDFLWTPDRPGDFTLRIVTTFPTGPPGFATEAPPPHVMHVRVTVR